jgi:hypothetical protein
VREVVVLAQEVDVVRADEAAPELVGEVRQLRVDHVLFLDALLLHLDEKWSGSKISR